MEYGQGKKRKVLVVGIGNMLLKDEGIGVHVAKAMQKLEPPKNIDLEIIDGGTSPDVLSLFQNIDKLVVVDAAKGGEEPGAIYRFRPDNLAQDARGITSLHQVGLPHYLKMMDYLGTKPREVIIFGIEPKEIGWGLEPSAKLGQKIPEIVKLILEEVEKC